MRPMRSERHGIGSGWSGPVVVAMLAMLAMGFAGACLPAAARGQAAEAAQAARDAAIRRWVRYPPVPARLSPQAELGRRMFFDTALSASGRMSCASCHDPARAYGPPDGRAVQPGGKDRLQSGMRAVPSLRYLDDTPLFSLHAFIPGSEDAEYEGPSGGFDQDGAAASRQQQAAGPLLDPSEMANASPAAVVAAVRDGAYAQQFAQVFGADVFRHPRQAFDDVGAALQAFQAEDPSFHPYTSKFDFWLEGKARFTQAELRGYQAFNDPAKGNCAACHLDRPTPDGRPPLFTDHQFEALGVPRNPALRANRDPHHFDLGLCGPYRADLAAETGYCGLFLTPSLRNVATRHVFFHNGVYHHLRQVLDFYDFRDVAPGRVYRRAPDGTVAIADDLPARYRGNLDRQDPPFGGARGARAPMSAADERDIIAFLRTLTDGYRPRGPAR